MGTWYRVDIPGPTGYKDPSWEYLSALSPGLKATGQLLELVLGWQGERNSLASEKIQVCGMWWGRNRGE